MMSFALEAVDNPADPSDGSMLGRTGLLLTLTDGFVLVIMNAQHQRSCVLQLSPSPIKAGHESTCSFNSFQGRREAFGLLRVHNANSGG